MVIVNAAVLAASAVGHVLAGPLLADPARDTPPLTPDGPTAQQWLRHELEHSEYQAAKPTWFDRIAHQIAEWFSSLGVHVSGDAGWVLASIGIALIVAILIGAFVVFGLPRLRRRTRVAEVFDERDSRDARALRADARAAAAVGRYDDAVRDLFRAIGRSLGERTVVLVLPGTTAQELAIEASRALPAFTRRLHDAAVLFDGVRYLNRHASADDYAGLATLDTDLAAARPQLSALQSTDGAPR
ncbi:DUF4129 domain-containing protein [Humibacter albus]|uniref:DUF4129 domain-containing protein n=1 Tax=Humibacter albus TaxID=427754 RepID=UPI0003B3165D|nr:DUF4129 domain-containing protein [Humibacter albus]